MDQMIIFGVAPGSILGLILLHVFISDFLLFIKETDICNFADDTVLYPCGKELDTIVFNLEIETNTVIQWLKDNEMAASYQSLNLCFFQSIKTLKKTCLLSTVFC